MIGYHYTSWENWAFIQTEGLKPYRIDHPKIENYRIIGIWLWRTRPLGIDHVGNIVFQMGVRASPHIVQLEIEFEPADEWVSADGDRINLTHTGSLSGSRQHGEVEIVVNRIIYHAGKPSIILGRRVPPRRIRLIGDYDLIERLS